MTRICFKVIQWWEWREVGVDIDEVRLVRRCSL